ncbi:MAG TPA: peptidoglycan DD-metalloendopeptidase family protein [Candidatus Binatia bacterium]
MWSVGAARRMGGALALAFVLALTAGILVTAGGALLARARSLGDAATGDVRFYVVARGPLAEATREGIALHPEIRLIGEHSIDQLIGETAFERRGDMLRVLEVAVPRGPDGDVAERVATLQQIDGVVEVIALGAVDVAAAPKASGRLGGAGIALIALGCALFVAGVTVTSTMAVRARADELAVRWLLGTEPVALWRPVGAVLGVTALAGVLGALGAALLVVRFVAPDAATSLASRGTVPLPSSLGSALAALVFALGAVGSAALAARRALLRLTAEPARLVGWAATLLLLSSVLTSAAVGSAATLDASATVPSEWQMLRGVARELAACRKGLHEAEKTLAETELVALRAYAKEDAVLLRLASAQREADARLVERWRESCAALEARRLELRAQHRASLFPGPPIEPRLAPVAGRVEVAFGEAGLPGKPRAFRNGVGLRTRPGEIVRASAPGKVVFSGDLAGAGRVVVVSHGRRTFSVYGRVAEALVVRGMEVEAGEPVARAGEGGTLYFSVRERGKAVDPIAWLRMEPTAVQTGTGG